MKTSNIPEPIQTPLTPAVFQILLALSEMEMHGYRIMQAVQQNSNRQMHMGPGTLYGSIKRMLADGLIEESGERPDPDLDDERRRYYRLTALGRKTVKAEAARMDALVRKAQALHLLPDREGDS
ncbi:MAG: helix-turn-helix transcriptional regulator [Anaerolineaceae bacterium]